jgi:Arc/MetJ family transcription regulator
MKMTIEIDDELLSRVMAKTGARTKTAAIELALNELDRRADLIRLLDDDLGMKPDDWRGVFDDATDLETLRAAETPGIYGKRTGPR